MSRHPGLPKNVDERGGNIADAPALDQRDCLALSLGIDEWAPPGEVRARVLLRVLWAVGHDPELEPGDSLASR